MADNHYLFRYLLLTNFLQYLEAGAVPAMLLQISTSFGMSPAEQGLLGAVVYLSLSLCGPFAGILLRRFEHKYVLLVALSLNIVLTLLWSLTPVGSPYSTRVFILIRFLMGFSQCVVCVFLPLWTMENAPRSRRTLWMSYLQASVPLGIMFGYIIASVVVALSRDSECGIFLCWRWPFIIEVLLLTPLPIALLFVDKNHVSVSVISNNNIKSLQGEGGTATTTITTTITSSSSGYGSMHSSECQMTDADYNNNLYDSDYRLNNLRIKEEEKDRRRMLRRQSCTTSLFGDVLSTRNVIKKSFEDFYILDSFSQSTDNRRISLGNQTYNNINNNNKNNINNQTYELVPTEIQNEEKLLSPTNSRSSADLLLLLSGGGKKRNSSIGISNGKLNISESGRKAMSVRKKLQKSLNELVNHLPLRSHNLPLDSNNNNNNNNNRVNYESLKELSSGCRVRTSNASDISMIDFNNNNNDFGSDLVFSDTVGSMEEGNVNNNNHNNSNNNNSKELDKDKDKNEMNVSHNNNNNISECFSNSESEEDWDDRLVAKNTNNNNNNNNNSSNNSVDLYSDDRSLSTFERLGGSCKPLLLLLDWIESLVSPIVTLLSIGVYRNLLGSMTCLYFTVTGIQYWGTKYLIVGLDAPSYLVNIMFIACAATGPTSGVFFGGYFVDRFGGFKGTKQRILALEICRIFGTLASLFSIPITLVNNLFLSVFCLWLVLFFGGSTLPACSGIIVSIVPKRHRPMSSSLSLIVFNLFGYFLSLFLSGMLMQYLDQNEDYCNALCSMTWGFRLILFWSFFSLLFLLNALKCSYRDRGVK